MKKKIILLLFIIVLSFTLLGCSSKKRHAIINNGNDRMYVEVKAYTIISSGVVRIYTTGGDVITTSWENVVIIYSED